MESQQRLLTFMLVVIAFSVPTAVILAVNFALQYGTIQTLKTKLLTESELQAELLAGNASDHSLMPHQVSDIGFVLNPHAKSSTFKSNDGVPYPINSLGLRGPEVAPKRRGEKRIVIAGDSVVFGWKLQDADRLSSILHQLYTTRSSGENSTEFVTVALPGWNVKSASAFVRSHLRLLEPDAIVWWTIANDIEDVPGVVPPGQLASWASPHAANATPFVNLSRLQKRSGSFMPLISEKRAHNLATISAIQRRYKIPVFLIIADNLLDREARQLFQGQRITIPNEFLNDRRWPLSATDRHPTRWANEIMAVGILAKLARTGILGDIALTDEEQQIADRFVALEQRFQSQPTSPQDFSDVISKLPIRYRPDDPASQEGALYGITAEGKMSKVGTILLRDPAGSTQAVLTLAPAGNMHLFPGSVVLTVRDRALQEARSVHRVDKELIEVAVPLPPAAAENGVRAYEVSWEFDFLTCTGPSTCSSARLLSAEFRD